MITLLLPLAAASGASFKAAQEVTAMYERLKGEWEKQVSMHGQAATVDMLTAHPHACLTPSWLTW
jgi:hypothetical protein